MDPTLPVLQQAARDVTRLRKLRGRLADIGFDAEPVQAVLGLHRGQVPDPVDQVVYGHRLAAAGALETAVSLLCVGLDVPVDQARVAMLTTLNDLIDMGLVEVAGDVVRSRVELLPFEGLLLMGDRRAAGHSSPDQVAALHPASTVLADITVRTPTHSVLDLGTGSGVQALLAARHSRRVLAVDVNERALAYTEINAALNDLPHIETRTADFSSAVSHDERFSLVVCNPPYVISPDYVETARDSGSSGDAMCRELLAILPNYLADGGIAQVLCNWGMRKDESWLDAVRRSIPATTEAVVTHFDTVDAVTYAASWNGWCRGTDQFAPALARWLASYREDGIDAIGYGAVTMRKAAAGAGWIVGVSVSSVRQNAGDHVSRLLDGQARVQSVRDDEALLAGHYELIDRHELHEVLVRSGGRYAIDSIRLRSRGGLGLAVQIPLEAVQVVNHLTPDEPAVVAVGRAAAGLGTDVQPLARVAAAAVRALLAAGLATCVQARS